MGFVVGQRGFEERTPKLRKLEERLKPFEKKSFSILDTINFRISISANTWFHGLVYGLDEKTLNKLPKDLSTLLKIYYDVSIQLDQFYLRIKDDGDASIKSYLGSRTKMISAITNIKNGLLKDAVSDLKSVLSVLQGNLDFRGNYPKGDFKTFWNKYTESKACFSNLFLPLFPKGYNPSIEPDYSTALKNSLNLEINCSNLALSGQNLSALEGVEEWFILMNNFINKESTRKLTPKRLI